MKWQLEDGVQPSDELIQKVKEAQKPIQEEVVNEVRAAFGYDLKISEADTGINFTTSDTSVYENLLAYLEELGVEPATIADITDQAYLNDVEY